MIKKTRVINLAAALAALGAPAALAPTDAGATPTIDPVAKPSEPKLTMRVGEDLMHFVVGESADGMIVASHSSHASHASHSSHASHASSMR